jgi:hypothetical protein
MTGSSRGDMGSGGLLPVPSTLRDAHSYQHHVRALQNSGESP